MNYIKIQTDLLKMALGGKIRRNNMHYQEYKEYIAIFNGDYIYFIPKILDYLDIPKIMDAPPARLNIDKFFKEMQPIKITNEIYMVNHRGKVIHCNVFTNQEGQKIYVKQDFLKVLDFADTQWYGMNPEAPILAKNNSGDLLALVMPVVREATDGKE